MKPFFTKQLGIVLILCLLCYFFGAVSYSFLNQEVDKEQANMVTMSLISLGAYESALNECIDFETRVCVVRVRNEKKLEVIEALYGE